MLEINHPKTIAEITDLYAQYETALCENDIEKLDALFWDSPQVVRFRLMENLYGSAAVKAFRRSRSGVKLKPELSNFTVTAFGTDTAIVTLEFIGGIIGKPAREGRQTQVWRKLPEGWKIVSAHVSWLPFQNQ
ncbi:oxalurate catabolism protein HpxZ [Cyanobacteria bacterium FACHB-63]|nr:oxalurate catabolism protein HpxZ [Cyanobacteria bacterium FACHB-63]